MDGSLLILKEWPPNVGLFDIQFSTITFFFQVHGLPPNLINQANAQKIGDQLGNLHLPSLNRSVVAGKYLCFRVDIPVKQALPAGYFMNKANGEERWIQFKFECRSYFCYKCRELSHVTGRCNLEFLATITTEHGLIADLYGPWL